MYKLTAIILTLTLIFTLLCGCKDKKKSKVRYTKYTESTAKRFNESYDFFAYDNITLVDLTETVANSETAQITVKAKPVTEYGIQVEYSSGISKSSSLCNKTTDSKGYCTWKWRIGSNTKAGNVTVRILSEDSVILETEILITKKQSAE